MSNEKAEKTERYYGIDGLTRYLEVSPTVRTDEWKVRIEGQEIRGIVELFDGAVFEHKAKPTLEQSVSVPEGVTVNLLSSVNGRISVRVRYTMPGPYASVQVSPGRPEWAAVYAVAAQIASMPKDIKCSSTEIVGPNDVE